MGSTLTFIAMVVLWEVLVVQLRIPGWTLPSPSAIAEAMIDLRSELFGHFMVTLYESLVEFALAIIISIPLAVAVVYSPILQNTIYPFCVGSENGLGYLILVSTSQSRNPLAFGALVLLTVMSILLYYGIAFMERIVVPWAPRN